LTPDVVAVAQERGQALGLENTVAELLAQAADGPVSTIDEQSDQKVRLTSNYLPRQPRLFATKIGKGNTNKMERHYETDT
jgi:hypothetical protein